MTDLRQAAQAVVDRWDSLSWSWSEKTPTADLIAALRTALEQQAEPPPEWLLVKNILDEYGLDAIAFVTAWKAVKQRAEPVAQRPWVGLTDEDWAKVADMPDSFYQRVAWAQASLKEKNSD